MGRKKTRPSELIRALLQSGSTLREAARIAKTSHGSVSLERKLMRQEEIAKQKELNIKERVENQAQLQVLDEVEPW